MIPERRLPKWVKPVAGAAGAAVLAGGIAFGVVKSQEQPRPPATETPSATAASPTPEKTPPPTIKVETQPPATKTPEKEIACLVLPKEFCSLAERVKVTTGETTVEYIALNLPPDTPVSARVNGFLDKTPESGQPFSGFRAVVRDDVGGTTFRGNLRFDNLFSKEVKAGEVIGYITTGTKTLGYDLLITITKRTPDGPVVDEAKLKELFPAAYEKPIKSIDAGKAQTIPSISHASASPSSK